MSSTGENDGSRTEEDMRSSLKGLLSWRECYVVTCETLIGIEKKSYQGEYYVGSECGSTLIDQI